MKICFENKSKDLSAEIIFQDKSVLIIPPATQKPVDVNDDYIIFSVKYVRDFTFSQQFIPKSDSKFNDRLTNKLTEKTIKTIGSAIIQVVNKYKVSDLENGSVIDVIDKAHYLSAEGLDAFLGCFPALYYFGEAECAGAKIEVLTSIPTNRPAFISLYKLIYRTINLHGFLFNIIKYKVQINRHRKISSPDYITRKFRELYKLPLDEREYQFKPLTVLTDKFLNFIKGKLPKRIYNKLVRKFKRYFNAY